MSINDTLVNFLNNSSTVCTPPGYNKKYPQESVASEGFVETNYYKLFSCFADAQDTFEYFRILVNNLINEPYNPLIASSFLLNALRNIIGLQFVTEDLTEEQVRQLLEAKLLANTNNGTISNTMTVFRALMLPLWIQRIRLGITSVNVSYAAIGGEGLIISISELSVFWSAATTGGIFIELRWGPQDYFGFSEDPLAMGFSSISNDLVVRVIPPYFGFFEDPDAVGFSTTYDPTSGGHMPVLVSALESGGHFFTTIYSEQGV